MVDTLVSAYSPLIFWVTLGIVLLQVLPEKTPYWLGRGLYWFGVPWQIFDLARHSQLSGDIGLTPTITVATLSVGLAIAWSVLMLLQRFNPPGGVRRISWLPTYDRYQYGSFIIAAMLGNTGFVGLGILPSIIEPAALSWAVFFSLTQNIIGTYFIGVLIASHFGQAEADGQAKAAGLLDPTEDEIRQARNRRLWKLLRDILTVPSLWAFGFGFASRSIALPDPIELFASSSLMFVVPTSFLLMGLRLAKIDGWTSLHSAMLPVGLKMILLPALVGIGTSFLGLTGDVRLGLVLMAGMPSAFASLILAEEYDMNRDLAASSIALSTVVLLGMIPVWLWIF
jgi:malate permease and related proteins